MKKKNKVRLLSIKMKVSLAMGAMVMLLCVVLGFNLYSNQKKNIMALAVDQTEMAAAMAADRIDADAAKDLVSFDTTSDSFKLVTEQLVEAREKCGMAYLYVLVANGGKVYYGADADIEGAAIGEEFEVSYEELKGVFSGQEYVQDYIDETEDGDLISAYVPLVASDGSVSAIIGCDYDATFINSCLKFLKGDIADYDGVDSIDMVVTLHACDTATDYALAKAVKWGASVILSVPCCQHELNKQIDSELMQPVFKYGIIKERMAALLTDALRAEYLEKCGYRTQILEFIDMEHTPKNLLIRGVLRKDGSGADNADKLKSIEEFYNVNPILKSLL